MTNPTAKQIDYVRSLQRRLHLPDRMLDDHCVKRFGVPFAEADRNQVGDLLEEMVGWETLPAEMQRAIPVRDTWKYRRDA